VEVNIIKQLHAVDCPYQLQQRYTVVDHVGYFSAVQELEVAGSKLSVSIIITSTASLFLLVN
jgi:hypothetical protein